MRPVVRLTLVGCALLALAALRAVAFPILEPADPEHPGFWITVSNYLLMLWVPALICFGMALLVWLRGLIINWSERS